MGVLKTDVDGKVLAKSPSMLREKVLFDVYKGTSKGMPSDSVSFYKDILIGRGQLYLWAQLAYQIFQSNSNSYWDHANKGWKGNFGRDGNYFDFIRLMCERQERNGGDDPSMSTGLMVTSSLKEVEQEAAKVAEQLIGRKLKAHQFIDACNIGPLHNDDKKQTVLCTFAGNRDRYGKTYQFGYNVFGLAFYNFKVRPIASGDIEYSTALNGMSLNEAIKKGYECPGFSSNVNYNSGTRTYPMINESREESSFSAKVSDSSSVTLSNSITNSKQYSFGQSIGISQSWKVGDDKTASTTTTLSMQFSFQEVMSTAYSETKSVTKSDNHESSISTPLPAHTALLVIQSGYEGKADLSYSCPVMVEFDVAVLSMCGTCYDDNAAVRKFNTAGYKQRSFCTLFNNQNGSDAAENLYIRQANRDTVKNYDKNNGITKVMQNNSVIGEEINWSAILNQEAATTAYVGKTDAYETEGGLSQGIGLLPPVSLIDTLTKYRPATSTGAVISHDMKLVSYEVKEPVALYPLSRIQLVDTPNIIDLKPGDILHPESWIIEGYDSDGVKFYGFDAGKGTWKIYDESGKESQEIICQETRRLTRENIFKAMKEGKAQVVYEIDKDAYQCKNGQINPDEVKTVSILLRVSNDVSVDKIEIQGERTVQVQSDSVVDLENLSNITVKAYAGGKELNVPLTWKVTEGSATIIDNKIEMNSMHCKVAATYGNVQSEELDLLKA